MLELLKLREVYRRPAAARRLLGNCTCVIVVIKSGDSFEESARRMSKEVVVKGDDKRRGHSHVAGFLWSRKYTLVIAPAPSSSRLNLGYPAALHAA